MKILFFGRGVISTQYAWALEQAGNQVEFYVRTGRAAQYGNTVQLEILDGRKNKKGDLIKKKWNVTLREDIPKHHDYDLIFVSINHNQMDEAVSWLSAHSGNSTIFICNNIWEEPLSLTKSLPNDQIVWGFPGGGGGFTNKSTLSGGFVKSIQLGFVNGESASPGYKKVWELFENAGFKISEQKNMKAAMKRGSLLRELMGGVMDANEINREGVTVFLRDVLDDASRLKVALPEREKLESLL